MVKTPEYTRRATANYQAKFDLMQIRLPKGTKQRIAETVDKSINDYIVSLVLDDLERIEGKQQESPDKWQKYQERERKRKELDAELDNQ